MLNNLRHLKWIVFAYDGKSLVSLIPLIEAAPFLHHHEQVSILWRNGGQSSPEGSQLVQFFQSLKVFYYVLCNYYCFSVCGFVENGGFLRFFCHFRLLGFVCGSAFISMLLFCLFVCFN